MKNIFRFLMAAVILFGAVSCAKEDISSSLAGGEVEVTFTANLPELGTRAYGDGLNATLLRYHVYDGANGAELEQLCGTATTTNGTFSFTLPLIKGMTYDFVLWADKNVGDVDNPQGFYAFDGKIATINYNGEANNNDRDAFYGFVDGFDPVRDDPHFELHRPFAQLNAATSDKALVEKSEVKLTTSTIAVKAYDKFDVTTGDIAADAQLIDVAFTAATMPCNLDPVEILKNGYDYLSMNYLLVPKGGMNVDVAFTFNGTKGIVFEETEYTNVPLKQNYRTNILGQLLTKSTEITVEIVPDFGGEEEYKVVEVATADDLQTALNNANVAEIVLTTDLTLDGTLTFGAPAATRAAEALPGRNFVIDGNGNTLKVVKAGTGRVIDFTSATNGASLTLKNLTIENNVSWIERIVNYNTTGTLTIDNVKIINAEGCKFNYAINLPGSSDESTVVINNSEIWANAIALNLWGEKTTANITNSKLYVVDNNPAEGYSVIALNNGGENAAHNSVVNIEGGEVKVIYEGEGETQPSSALRDATNGSEINISETTEVVGEMKLPVANVLYEGYDQFYSFTNLGAAIAKAQENNNGTVCLIKDITLSEPINIAADDFQVVIDLNGKTIKAAYVEGSETNHVYAFENYGNIKITGNGTINARGIFNYGAMTLEDGTINAIDGNGGYAIRNYEGATFTMNGGKLATTLEDDHQVDKGGYDATTLRVDEGATATINGGVIENICDFTFAIDNSGDVTIKGGTISSVHSTISTEGTMTINGGSFTCNGLEGITAHALVAWGGSTTTINGGTFDGKDNYNGFNIDADEGAVVTIKGGNFLPVHSGSLYGKGTITVYGGTFFDNTWAEERLAKGYTAVLNSNNTYTVEMKNATPSNEQEFIKAVAEGGIITLQNDITLTQIAVITEGNTVLDGNGHTITSSAQRAINVSGATEATIKNLNIVATGERAINIIQNTSKVNIENVTATAANYTVNVAGSSNNTVVAIKESTLTGLCTVNVSGAGAMVTLDHCTVNCNDNNTTEGESYSALSLNRDAIGGSIIATNTTVNVPADSDSNKGRNSAANGVVTINGSTDGVAIMVAFVEYEGSDYYYSFTSLQDAINWVDEKGDGNITLARPVEIDGEVVELDLKGETVTAPYSSAIEAKNGGKVTIKGEGTINAHEAVVRALGGEVVIENCKFTQTGTALDSQATYRYAIDCREGGKITINGGEFKSKNGMINVGSEVIINGGKFENIVEKTMTRHFAYVSAPLTINGGEFYGKANSSAGGCFFCGAGAGGEIYIYGGKFTSLWTSGSVNRIFESYSGGKVKEITGGLFNTNGGIKDFVVANTDEATKDAYPYVAK